MYKPRILSIKKRRKRPHIHNRSYKSGKKALVNRHIPKSIKKVYKSKGYPFLRKKFNIHPLADDDGDKVRNYEDCRPFNRNMQDLKIISETGVGFRGFGTETTGLRGEITLGKSKKITWFDYIEDGIKQGELSVHEFPDFIVLSNVEISDKGKGKGTKMIKEAIEYIKQKYPDKPIKAYPASERSRSFFERLGFEEEVGGMIVLKV